MPSPATSDVLLATSFTIWAPMFSSASFKSISFATVTPSLVIVGDPNALAEDDVAPSRSQRHFHGVRQAVDPAQNRLARRIPVRNLVGHQRLRSWIATIVPMRCVDSSSRR